MRKVKKPRLEFADIADIDERKKALELCLKPLSDLPSQYGEPEVSAFDRKSRYGMSIGIIFFTTLIATTILSACSLYFMTLPSPLVYASTQEGKLYPITPIRTE